MPAVLWAAAVPAQRAALTAKLTKVRVRVLTLCQAFNRKMYRLKAKCLMFQLIPRMQSNTLGLCFIPLCFPFQLTGNKFAALCSAGHKTVVCSCTGHMVPAAQPHRCSPDLECIPGEAAAGSCLRLGEPLSAYKSCLFLPGSPATAAWVSSAIRTCFLRKVSGEMKWLV